MDGKGMELSDGLLTYLDWDWYVVDCFKEIRMIGHAVKTDDEDHPYSIIEFPAYVGMNRRQVKKISLGYRVPHMRGDDTQKEVEWGRGCERRVCGGQGRWHDRLLFHLRPCGIHGLSHRPHQDGEAQHIKALLREDLQNIRRSIHDETQFTGQIHAISNL